MKLSYEKLNLLISQRLKLACKDMAYAELDTVLMRVLSQNRIVSGEKQRAELGYLRKLTENAQTIVAEMKYKGHEMFKKQLDEMGLSDKQLSRLLSMVAEQLKETAEEKRLDGWASLGTMCAYLEQISAHYKDGSENHLDRAYLTELLGRSLSEIGLGYLADGSLAASDERNRNSPVNILHSLNDNWHHFSASERNDRVRLLGECMSAKTLLMLGEDEKPDTAILEKYENVMAYRLVAVGAMLNLRYCGALPEELEDLRDEDLAVLACAASELDYYYAALTYGCLDADTVCITIAALLLGLFCALVGVILVSVCELACILFGLLYVLMGLYICWRGIMETVDALCPAGFGETLAGVKICRGAVRVRAWAEELAARFHGFSGGFPGPGPDGGDDGADEREYIQAIEARQQAARRFHQTALARYGREEDRTTLYN